METRTAVTTLAALAQETRLEVFRLLIQAGPPGVSVGRIADELGVAAPTLSFHLKELTRAGLIVARQEGRFIYYSANFEQMASLMSFLTENCCRGMPEECLTIVETAFARCCPSGESDSKRSMGKRRGR